MNDIEDPQANGAADASESPSADAPAPIMGEGMSDRPPSDGALEAEVLRGEIAVLKDRLLRTMADMENLRRRTDKEVADARSYGAANFARDMLGVSDNLRRGIESLGELKSSADPAVQSFVEGVQLTEADFLSRLTRHGVKKMSAEGQKFDPNRHEALFEVPDDNVPAGVVVQVVEAGYTIGERVLRPAKVGISRGGPKA